MADYSPRDGDRDSFMTEFEDSGLRFDQALSQARMAVCVTNPRLHDNPIVFANDAFLDLTGYELRDILGHNCRFLQGPKTNREHVLALRDAVHARKSIVVELLNYRKDGTPFWNALHVGPIFDADGELLYYFGSQWDVTDVHNAREDAPRVSDFAREMSHRLKSAFSMVGTAMSANKATASQASGQLSAMGRAYNASVLGSTSGQVSLAEVVENVIRTEGPERFSLDGPDADVPETALSLVALCLHELTLATDDDEQVELGWHAPTQTDITLTWKSDSPERAYPVLEGLLAKIGGSISRGADGLELVLPLAVEC